MFIPITRGDSYLATFNLYNSDKSVHNMKAGEQLTFTIKTSRTVADATISKYYNNGITFNKSSGKYEVDIDAKSTEILGQMDYPFDIEYVSSTGDVKTLINGNFRVCLDVTEPLNRQEPVSLLSAPTYLGIVDTQEEDLNNIWAQADTSGKSNEVFLGNFNISMSYREKVGETKTVIPTKETQYVRPQDEDHEITEVLIRPIPEEYQDVSATTATPKDVLKGKEYFDNTGKLVEGEIEWFLGPTTITPQKRQQQFDTLGKFVQQDLIVEPIPENYNDTSDSTADTNDVLQGKTFFNSTGKVEGSIETYADSTSIVPVEDSERQFNTAGKYIEENLIVEPIPELTKELNEQDEKIATLRSEIENLPDPPDLSKMTATAADILIGKTAYTKDGETTGTLVDRLQWKCDNVQSLNNEFENYTGTSLNEILNGLDTSKVKSFKNTFNMCSNLVDIPQLNFSNATNVSYWLANCGKVAGEIVMDIPQCTTADNMFRNNYKITKVKLISTGKVSTFNSCLNNCQGITSVEIETMESATTNTSLASMFSMLVALENLKIHNIRVNLTIGSGTSYGTLLTDESLINTAQELWDFTGSTSKTLTVSTPSNARFDAIYVKLTTATEEMIAEDPYINNKKPCEVCESTDEGAMSLREYVVSKNWALA